MHAFMRWQGFDLETGTGVLPNPTGLSSVKPIDPVFDLNDTQFLQDLPDFLTLTDFNSGTSYPELSTTLDTTWVGLEGDMGLGGED